MSPHAKISTKYITNNMNMKNMPEDATQDVRQDVTIEESRQVYFRKWAIEQAVSVIMISRGELIPTAKEIERYVLESESSKAAISSGVS